jgi:hypothetical protein
MMDLIDTYDNERIDLDELEPKDTQTIVAAMLDQADKWYAQHLEPEQVEATEFYSAEQGILPAEEGRSKLVSSDLRDAVRAITPSLLRIFGGPDNNVAYQPDRPEEEAQAEQATDYVKHIIWEDNPGFINMHSVIKDLLIRKLGAMKWYVEQMVKVTAENLSGLTIEQLALLQEEEGVELEVTGVEDLPGDAMTGMPPQQVYDAVITRRVQEKRIKVCAVPPNEFRFTPNARNLDEAPLVAHVRQVKASDLVAMGIDRELVRTAMGKHRAVTSSTLEGARSLGGADPFSSEAEGDESVRDVLFAEAYVLIDLDDDGIAERRMFQCVGPDYEIVNGDGEIVDDVPFADFPMDPEAHAIVGHCLHDYLRDVQLVKSQVLRATMNSLALSLDQKTEVVAGEVNIDDLLKNELGGVVRVRKPGMMREVRHEFLGPATMPMMEYFDQVKEDRTGISKAAAGLDADSLQSSTKAAVAATLSSAQQQVEQIARVIAETGMRRLYRGLLRTIVRHQDRPRLVRLRGSYVEIDPRSWNAELGVTVTLATGSPEERMTVLTSIAGIQEQHLQQGSPLVTWRELRNTYARILELAGFKNPDQFFKPFGPQEEQQLQQQQQQAQQQQQQDPTAALVQVEAQKVQQEAMAQQQKMELERWKIQLQDDRERDKIAREFTLKTLELQMKYSTLAQTEQLYAQVERDRAAMDADIQLQQAQQAAQQAAQQPPAPEGAV